MDTPSMKRPNAKADRARARGVGRARWATTRPPTTAPPLMKAYMAPSTPAPPWKLNLASKGSVTVNS